MSSGSTFLLYVLNTMKRFFFFFVFCFVYVKLFLFQHRVGIVVSVLVRVTFYGADRARKQSRLSLLVVKGRDNVPIEEKLSVTS